MLRYSAEAVPATHTLSAAGSILPQEPQESKESDERRRLAHASRPSSPPLPDASTPLSEGLPLVHQKAYRWKTLPVCVYSMGGSVEQLSWLKTTMAQWSAAVASKLVSTPEQADIIIDWHTTLPSTEPAEAAVPLKLLLHLDPKQQVKTFVLIEMAPLAQNPMHNQRRLAHRFGHALGYWGHAPQPDRLMFALLPEEQTDLPSFLNWQHHAVKGHGQGQASHLLSPSAEDLLLLKAVYTYPTSQDLSLYSLKH
jgi:hypothetical protein